MAHRRYRLLSLLGTALLVAVAALSWLGFVKLKRHEQSLTQFQTIFKAIDALSERVKDSESKPQAPAAGGNSSPAELDRVAALQQELDRMRQEMERQSGELDALRRQLAEEKNRAAETRVARREVPPETSGVPLERINFEVPRNQSQEIGGGVSLCVTGANATQRRVNGYIWIVPDRRTIWLRDQAIQQPVTFFSSRDGRKRELVITGVTTRSATGYLLLPKPAGDSARPRPGD